jgi:hypothetical protein
MTDAEVAALKAQWERLGVMAGVEVVIVRPTVLRRLAIRLRNWSARRLEARYARYA